VCGSDDGSTLLKNTLSKPPYMLVLTDDVEACDHVMVVVSQGVFKQDKTQQVLDKAINSSKTFMMLLETDPAYGGAPIEHFLDKSAAEIPEKYQRLLQVEWVPLYRSPEALMSASILTALRQRELAPHQESTAGNLGMFLSHQQAKAQVCIYIYIHMHIHIHIYTHTHIYIRVYIYIHAHSFVPFSVAFCRNSRDVNQGNS
jgi:hypothetical protein